MKWLRMRKRRCLIPVYMVFYLLSFRFLEKHVTTNYHVITSPLDKYIPFCEVFVIPYYLWFVYMTAVLIYFAFFSASIREYNQLAFTLGIGMTIFLLVSLLYPNGLHLRPASFPRDNFLTRWVAALYRTDTPTNVFPSIHVFNSLAACVAIHRCQALKKRRRIRIGSLILSVLIILSTMFLKQHSFTDVTAAFLMYAVLYVLIYRPERLFAPAHSKISAD